MQKSLRLTFPTSSSVIRDALKKAAAENVIELSDGKNVSDIIARSLQDEFADIDKRNLASGIYSEANGEQRLMIALSCPENQ